MRRPRNIMRISLVFLGLALLGGASFPPVSPAGTANPLLGQVSMFGFDFTPENWLKANGQHLSIADYETLFAVARDSFGPYNYSYFTAPNFTNRIMPGASGTPGATGGNTLAQLTAAPTGDEVAVQVLEQSGAASYNLGDNPPALPLNVEFTTAGYWPQFETINDMAGAIIGFMGDYTPAGYLPCAGQAVDRALYPYLFDAIGTTYGDGDGDGKTFTLPDLSGRSPLGSGTRADDGVTYSAGQIGGSQYATANAASGHNSFGGSSWLSPTIDIMPPYQEIRWAISVGSNDNASEYFIGTILPWAGSSVPSGWSKAQGQILSIEDHTILYSLLGTFYGGDGHTNFRLPDLSGRFPVGFDDKLGYQRGTTYPSKQSASDKGVTVWDTGMDTGLEAMPPYQVLDFIICTEGGIYPMRQP